MPDPSLAAHASAKAQRDDELFDIVDASDRVIGQAERALVHATGLRHRASHILVFNDKQELLIQQRSEAKDTAPLKWDTSAAGHLDSGEDYEQAAFRELAEELHIQPVGELRLLFKLSAQAATGQEFISVFRCLADSEPVPEPSEIKALRWCSRAELNDWIRSEPEVFTTGFRLIYASLAERDWTR